VYYEPLNQCFSYQERREGGGGRGASKGVVIIVSVKKSREMPS